jgi:hypothetical protein
MKILIPSALSLLLCAGCVASSQSPSEPVATTTQSFGLEDIDYQIKITKEAMEQYRNQAFLLNEKAQRMLGFDFSEYRHVETLREQAKAIADDLAQRLQSLEEQRSQMVKEMESKKGSSKQ